MLALEVEYLTGAVVACAGEATFDWPPQADRVFSALVASWGARGEDSDERAALEWLERQPPPRIIATAASTRITQPTYVPPNDFKTTTKGGLGVIPARRSRQERTFAIGRPEESTVTMIWHESADEGVQGRLDAIARDAAYIGHSASLTRCRFLQGEFDLSKSAAPAKRVYPGRLAELERRFHAGLRPTLVSDIAVNAIASNSAAVESVFSEDWIILEDLGGAPDLLSFPIVAKALRRAIMEAYDGGKGEMPEWLSGHQNSGAQSANPHMAIVPLADVGWERSEGRLMGCAIIVPRAIPWLTLVPSIRQLLASGRDSGRTIELHYGADKPWTLRPTMEANKASLNPKRWIAPRAQGGNGESRTVWATATPIVLDRYPKRRDMSERADEIGLQIAKACSNIGLPTPCRVSINAYSTLRGVPAALSDHRVAEPRSWCMPQRLSGRYLVHATMEFEQPVRGPVLLGAGRYIGLGLCLPAQEHATS